MCSVVVKVVIIIVITRSSGSARELHRMRTLRGELDSSTPRVSGVLWTVVVEG